MSEEMQRVAKAIAKAPDFSRMVSISKHPLPGEYVMTSIQAGNINGEKGWHLYVGYVVQVRKQAGAFGSDLILLRHPDGTLTQHHNQCFLRLSPEQETALKSIYSPGMTPDEYEDYTQAYTLGDGQYPAIGMIIEPGDAEAPPQDNSPMVRSPSRTKMAARTSTLSKPTPYYQDANTTLYLGDMRDIIPALGLKADAVITDPPYGETKLKWDRWPEGWPAVAASAAKQMWCFGTLRMFMDKAPELYADWKLSHDIIWEKQNGSGMRNDRFRRVHEQGAHFYQGEWGQIYKNPQYTYDAKQRTIRRQSKPAHWGGISGATHKSEEGGPRLQTSVLQVRNCHGYAIHPTQKPEGIIRPLLAYSVPPGGTVLDCFAGSGTTAVVARELGMKAICIEGDEAHCEGIVQRLSQAPLLLAL